MTFVHDTLLDVAVQMRVQMSAGMARLSVRQSAAGAYTAVLSADGSLTLFKGGTVLGANTTQPIQAGAWHTLRLSAVGGLVRVALDGMELIAAQDAASLPAGTLSFASIGGEVVTVDDVEVFIPHGNSSIGLPDTAPATVTLVGEPPLQEIYSDSFDRDYQYLWMENTPWHIGFSQTSYGAITHQSGKGLLLDNFLQDVVISATFEVFNGTSQLIARESMDGAYIAGLAQSGLLTLHRGEILMQSVMLPAIQYANEQHVLRLSVIGDTIRVAVDDVEQFVAQDSIPLPSGRATFAAHLNTLNSAQESLLKIDDVTLAVPQGTSIVPQPVGIAPPAYLNEEFSIQANNVTPNALQLPLRNMTAYSPDGNHDVYVRNPLDPNDIGTPIISFSDGDESYASISPDGTKIVFSSTHQGQVGIGGSVARNLYYINLMEPGLSFPVPPNKWIPLTLNVAPVLSYQNIYPAWSFDSRKIAFVSNTPASGDTLQWDLWFINDITQPSFINRLSTTGPYSEFSPSWSPSGQIAFMVSGCTVPSNFNLLQVPVVTVPYQATSCTGLYPGGSNYSVIVNALGDEGMVNLWSSNGQYVLYNRIQAPGALPPAGVFIRRFDGQLIQFPGGTPQVELPLVLATPGTDPGNNRYYAPNWSPDNNTVAYVKSIDLPAYPGYVYIQSISISGNTVVVGSPQAQPTSWHILDTNFHWQQPILISGATLTPTPTSTLPPFATNTPIPTVPPATATAQAVATLQAVFPAPLLVTPVRLSDGNADIHVPTVTDLPPLCSRDIDQYPDPGDTGDSVISPGTGRVFVIDQAIDDNLGLGNFMSLYLPFTSLPSQLQSLLTQTYPRIAQGRSAANAAGRTDYLMMGFGHLSSISASESQGVVKANPIIGTTGKTGLLAADREHLDVTTFYVSNSGLYDIRPDTHGSPNRMQNYFGVFLQRDDGTYGIRQAVDPIILWPFVTYSPAPTPETCGYQ